MTTAISQSTCADRGLLTVLGAVLSMTFGLVGSAAAQDLDLDVIFNCSADGPLGPQTRDECMISRDLVLLNCTACHTFVPIVKAQKDAAAWNATLNPHRERMPDVSDADYERMSVFLKSHYNPENEPPTLPPALEALGDIPQ